MVDTLVVCDAACGARYGAYVAYAAVYDARHALCVSYTLRPLRVVIALMSVVLALLVAAPLMVAVTYVHLLSSLANCLEKSVRLRCAVNTGGSSYDS